MKRVHLDRRKCGLHLNLLLLLPPLKLVAGIRTPRAAGEDVPAFLYLKGVIKKRKEKREEGDVQIYSPEKSPEDAFSVRSERYLSDP